MRTCPYCAEKIKDGAVVCRWCGRDLDPVAAQSESAGASIAGGSVTKSRSRAAAAIAIWLALGLVVGGVAGLLAGRTSRAADVRRASLQEQRAEADLETAQLSASDAEAANQELHSELSDLSANLDDAQGDALALRRRLGRYQEAMDWCRLLAEYVNTNGFAFGIGRTDELSDGFYRRVNKCIEPTGFFYH